MPPSAGTLRVGRYFAALLALLIVLYGILFWPGQPRTPKLGLDLEGGTQVILKADANGKTPSKSAMNTARQIIDDRVNGLGVSSAEVAIQGNDRIIVSVPGKNGDAVKNIGNSFLLQFRPEIIAPISAAPATTTVPSGSSAASATPTASGSANATAKPTGSGASAATTSPSPRGRVVPNLAGSATPSSPVATPSSTPAATPTASNGASPSASGTATSTGTQVVDQWKTLGFAPPKDATAYNALTTAQQTSVQTVLAAWDCSNKSLRPLDQVDKPLVSCSQDGTAKYLLGAVIVEGKQIKSANAVAPGSNGTNFEWSISLSLKTTGQQQWASYTSKHNEQSNAGDIANTVAYTLDSDVIQAATISTTITGDTSISGSFTQTTANDFANSLKYGALPLNFSTLNNTTLSATLGTEQLKAGLLAGGIGLLLVVIYSMIYYRALGLVTIASLVVSGGLTYAMLVILGKQIGFTLTLAGIAGFIVAVGITADSFVVFFERIKDEVHEGRSSRVAIPRAWVRSRRTILSADFVSFLAAVTLYYFAAGEVKGFAFTLGLSTVLDLVVVFLFTHPLVSLFSRSAAFGSARFTGLNHVRVGGVASYRSSQKSPRSAARSAALAESVESDYAVYDGLAESEPDDPSTVDAGPVPPADEPTSPPESAATFEPGPTRAGSATAGSAAGSTAAERAAARRAAQRERDSASKKENR
ncbi:protein translocase subunit SecD [soil metagenome]